MTEEQFRQADDLLPVDVRQALVGQTWITYDSYRFQRFIASPPLAVLSRVHRDSSPVIVAVDQVLALRALHESER